MQSRISQHIHKNTNYSYTRSLSVLTWPSSFTETCEYGRGEMEMDGDDNIQASRKRRQLCQFK